MGHVLLNPMLTVTPAIRRIPNRGIYAWLASICYLNQNRREETFPRELVRRFEATPKIVKALIDEGLWVEVGRDIAVPQFVDHYSTEIQIWKYGPREESRPTIPAHLRAAVYERDGHACLHCGTAENLTLDHIHPFSLGGEDTFENLQTLCRSCNSRKGARI